MTDNRSSAVGASVGGFHIWRRWDWLHAAWSLFCNVKFALLQVAAAAGAGLLGILFPQVPIAMRSNPAARSAWIELRREAFGPFTDSIDALYLFDVFSAPWFYALWVSILLSVTVCTVSRVSPTARSIHRSPHTVPDRYFDAARYRDHVNHQGGIAVVEAALRRRGYRLGRRVHTNGGIQVSAQRNSWSLYGTFLSHLALLMILVGALLTRFTGFDRMLVVAETTAGAPVFSTPGPAQLFVQVIDAYRGIDTDGNIVDYRTQLRIRRGSDEVTCATTVNDPCRTFGYRFHQAAWFNDIARLRVVAPDGQAVFDHIVDFESRTTRVPHFTFLTADGVRVIDGPLAQLGTESGSSAGPEDDIAVSLLEIPATVLAPLPPARVYAVAWRLINGELRVIVSGEALPDRALTARESVALPGGTLIYQGPVDIPALQVPDMPGAAEGATLQMLGESGSVALVISGIADSAVRLSPGREYVSEDGYRYTFGGRVEAAGIDVRRDPGGTFIWIGVGMALIGLCVTFYLPRSRIWARVTTRGTDLAGTADRTFDLRRDFEAIRRYISERTQQP